MKVKILSALNAALVLAAIILSVISSNMAYSFDIGLVIGCGAAVIALDLVCLLLGERLPPPAVDAAFLATTILTTLSLCAVIKGRILLIGYIYFSDLESSNPVAIAAMNLAIIACACYLLALINYIISFTNPS